MRLGKYLLAKAPDNGEFLMVQTAAPHIVGCVLCFHKKNTNAAENIIQDMVNGRQYAAKVQGYNVFITFATVMGGSRTEIPGETINAILREMADYYLEEIIGKRPNAYKINKED